MIDYLYDGSFDGFLCCVHAHYYQEKAEGIFRKDHYQSHLLGGYCEIETDENKAEKVYAAIRRKISPFDLERIYRVLLSDVEGKETKLLRYIVLGFSVGPALSLRHGDPIVFDVQQIEYKVTRETHRLLGLIRFSALRGGVLYASVEPDHDVLELLADHFSDRLKNDPFIIHDKRRDKALIAREGQWYVAGFQAKEVPALDDDEKSFRALWKNYFSTIAIKERINPRCQRNFMPVRYWKNLTEMQSIL